MTAVDAACAAWDHGGPDAAEAVAADLAGALELAHDLNYF